MVHEPDGTTTLSGPLPDQAVRIADTAAAINRLGLILLSLERQEGEQDQRKRDADHPDAFVLRQRESEHVKENVSIMQARMSQNPIMIVPGAKQALQALRTLRESVEQQGVVPWRTIDLLQLRVSQINGCSACIEEHVRLLKEAGETDELLASVAVWQETRFWSPAERAALALAEAITRIADQAEPVPDAIWNEATRHYDEQGLATLVLMISTANLFTRLSAATRQVAGVLKGEARREHAPRT